MITYNEAYVQSFRDNFAVTDTLIVGETYYSNSYPSEFTVKRLLTNGEKYKSIGLVYDRGDVNELGWFETETGSIFSLRDNNIGASYNPWLIFKSASLRDQYQAGLVVGYEKEYDWTEYDAYDLYDFEELI